MDGVLDTGMLFANLVVVKENQFANAASRQHVGGDATDTSHANNDDAHAANALVILDDAHSLQRHQSAVRVGIDHLGRELLDLLTDLSSVKLPAEHHQRNDPTTNQPTTFV